MTNDFKTNWTEVGAAWNKEKSISIALKETITPNDHLMMLVNNSENPKAPNFRIFKKNATV